MVFWLTTFQVLEHIRFRGLPLSPALYEEAVAACAGQQGRAALGGEDDRGGLRAIGVPGIPGRDEDGLGILGTNLGCIGIYWDILGYIEMYWDILGYIVCI